jgi:hypothetical protein
MKRFKYGTKRNHMKNSCFLFLAILMALSLSACGLFHRAERSGSSGMVWNLVDLLQPDAGHRTISGTPKPVDSPYGTAVHLNGAGDAIIMDTNPLAGLKRYTIEVLISPDSDGAYAQRFLHLGQLSGDRTMVEIRMRDGQWWLDTYVRSGKSALTLIDSTKTHSANAWHHVAFTVDDGKLTSYVDGQKELEGKIDFTPALSGKAAIGCRMNKQYWFKGSLCRIRITPEALSSGSFKLQ